MTTSYKAIRSSGWNTDFLIGFPDGLFLLFFATQVMEGFPMEVQTFYTIHICIWLIGGLLVMYSAYQANKGDAQHDSAILSDNERSKLQQLDINEGMIEQIADEMIKDAAVWENTLEQEQVKETTFIRSRAIRSAVLTCLFFLLGGSLSLGPYLSNENFTAASQTSMMLVFLGLTIFSFIKAKITSQRPLPLILRYWLMGAGILGGAWILHKVF
ncbi:VIT1/CCC1 transporter family protein [Chitinophaga sp. MM2321]|uniref:VIT1/CCC1 transporter family protein n=1 Tax=Chitinophaga sp. MM2321 TaxID=3137178 RepID=UPI0032D57B7E